MDIATKPPGAYTARVVDTARVRLIGRQVILEPMEAAHHDALCAVGLDPDLWRLTTIRLRTPQDMRDYMDKAAAGEADGTALPFVITLQESGQVIGATRFHSIARTERRAEIGFTWIARPWQRTAVNTDTKYLMLRHAFEVMGCERVEFRADGENEPSRRALLRIGATEEGLLRRHRPTAHRGWRDIRVFSIIAPEWPRVRARLESLLAD
jgi:N-acetyltransferase